MAKIKRKAIRPIDRFEIFKRDKFTCQYCNRTPPTTTLEIDHIIAVAEGGGDEIENLITACFECNRGKAARLLTAVSQPLSERMAEERERTTQVEAYNQFLLDKRKQVDEIILRLGRTWNNLMNDEKGLVFGVARSGSMRRILSELTETEVMDSIEITYSNLPRWKGDEERGWRYLCGVCWRKIHNRREGVSPIP